MESLYLIQWGKKEKRKKNPIAVPGVCQHGPESYRNVSGASMPLRTEESKKGVSARYQYSVPNQVLSDYSVMVHLYIYYNLYNFLPLHGF